MDSHLHIVSLRNIHRRAYRLGSRAPVLVNLQTAGTRRNLLLDRFTARAVTLAQKADIHRHCLRRLKHLLDIPHARGDGRTIGAIGRTYTASDEGCDTITQCRLRLLWRDEVNVTINSRCGEDEVLARDSIGGCTSNQIGINAIHRVGVTRLADACNLAILDTHIGLHNTQQRVNNSHIGDYQIQRTRL